MREGAGGSYSFQLHLLPLACLSKFHGTPSAEELAFHTSGRVGGKTTSGVVSESIANAVLGSLLPPSVRIWSEKL